MLATERRREPGQADPIAMPPPRITRHFVMVGPRRVHYLRAGSGPARR